MARSTKSLRGGIIDRSGKFADDNADACVNVIVNHILRLISAVWYGASIGPFEKPAVPVVTLDAKPSFVHQPMVA